MKKYLRLIAGALLLLMLCSAVACNTGTDTPSETPPEITTDAPTETETETDVVGSIQESTAPETETEGLQIEITPDSPTSGTLITFYENSANEVLFGGKYCAYGLVADGDATPISRWITPPTCSSWG